MAGKIYGDDPPQFFKPNISNNSPDVAGYLVAVEEDTGTTRIFKKGKDGYLSAVGIIEKGGGFVASPIGQFSNQATQAEKDYFTANARKTVTEQAVPVVNRGIGGNAGGGNAKINDILGTKLATPPDTAPFSEDITNIEGVSDRSSYGPYSYPSTLDLKTQDVIKFTMIKPVATKFNTEFGAKTLSSKYNLDNNLGYVILPIQPSISDSNTVNWSGLNLNAFEAYAAGQAINLAKSSSLPELFSKAGASIQDIAGKFLQSTELQQAAQIGLAQEAVGIQGLLSRATGAVINPNLELLFNGPELRTFAFTFRMSPRSKDDAYQVRSIIRFFKQGMSVKTTSSSIFLKSPHVFKIQYKTPGREDHPSINRIKICALVGCDVDYTPDGTYMTFNDEERKHPMTSYGMSLRFSEIEPVYDQDYKGFQEDEIGY